MKERLVDESAIQPEITNINQPNSYSSMTEPRAHQNNSPVTDDSLQSGTTSALSIAAADVDIYSEPHVTLSQLIGGSIGNVLEWYDFAVFGYVANELSKNFFPKQSRAAQV